MKGKDFLLLLFYRLCSAFIVQMIYDLSLSLSFAPMKPLFNNARSVFHSRELRLSGRYVKAMHK